MKIEYIQYHNYRCFPDAKISFDTDNKKNISLVVGANGAGKTEMLFSFQWVLYDFDFRSMREKEETPYALNSSLHHKLEHDKHSNAQDCWAKMCFTNDNKEYTITRTETFMRVKDKVESRQKVELRIKKTNGETGTAITDPKEVEGIISRIIPRSILEGITFDGERMKMLNIANKDTVQTIKSVISKVNNEELFLFCDNEIKELRTDLSALIRAEKKKCGENDSASLDELIQKLEDAIEDNQIHIYGLDENLKLAKVELEKISVQLSDVEAVKSLEQERKGYEKDLATLKKSYAVNLEDFSKDLLDGYCLITDKLINDVRSTLEAVDVPAGLNVEAVDSILKRNNCICGECLTPEMRIVLEKLKLTLPPDNINSTISEMTRYMQMHKKDVVIPQLRRSYKKLHDTEVEINTAKEEIARISSELNNYDQQNVRDLERRRNELIGDIRVYETELSARNKSLQTDSKRLADAKKEKANHDSASAVINKLEAEKELLDIYKQAIQKICERTRELSLSKINDYLTKAYSQISEDYGRQIYICQHTPKEKYNLRTFVKSKYKEIETLWTNDATIAALKSEGLSDSEIREKIIIEAKDSKSTGQSKINSLAFAKAILDYSNEERDADSLEIKHDYPFLIDSPFTELDGDNLDNSAKYLNTFASQIILMASKKSLEGVNDFISPFVKTKTELVKDKIKGVTTIL